MAIRRLLQRVAILTAGALLATYVAVLGALYIYQRDMQYPVQREGAEATPADLPGFNIQDERIRAPDGETLQAWYAPAQPGKPTILFLHGNAGTLIGEKWRFLRMRNEGVGYLALSYRGYGLSTGSPSEDGLLIDGLAAYDWLRAHGIAANDIVIHGHSLGSGVGIYVATKRPARALILEAPFTAAVDVAAYHYWYMPVGLLMTDQFLSRERIKDVHIPVLIAHGDLDSVIPFEQGAQLFASANAPKEFVRMHLSDHSTLTRDGVYACYWRFLGLPYDVADTHVCGTL